MYNTYYIIKVKQKNYRYGKRRKKQPQQIDMRKGTERIVEIYVIKTPNQVDWVFLLHNSPYAVSG